MQIYSVLLNSSSGCMKKSWVYLVAAHFKKHHMLNVKVFIPSPSQCPRSFLVSPIAGWPSASPFPFHCPVHAFIHLPQNCYKRKYYLFQTPYISYATKKVKHLAISVQLSSNKIYFWLLQLRAIYTIPELLLCYYLAFVDGQVSSDY